MSRAAFKVRAEGARQVTALLYPADRARRCAVTLVLAHGAGAPQESRFMVDFARALAERGVDVVTFNFLYTEEKRKAPDRTEGLEKCYAAVIDAVRQRAELAGNRMAIGGKSMGGRIATHLAAGGVAARWDGGGALAGVVLLGYPLHPPGRPDRPRTEHLPRVTVPMLFVQGERDTFGTSGELAPVLDGIPARTTLHTIAGGDHSFKVPAKSAVPQLEVYAAVQDAIASWLCGGPA